MTSITQEFKDTAFFCAQSIAFSFKALADSTDVVDKFCKLTTQIIEATHPVTQSFKDTTGIFSMFGGVSTINLMLQPNWQNVSNDKYWSKISLLGAQILEVGKGLDSLKLISLSNISNTMGRFPVFGAAVRVCPPISIIKDSLIVFSTYYSFKENWNERKRLLKTQVQVLQLDKADKQEHAKNMYKNRIGIISDLFKLAIVGLMLGLGLYGMVMGGSVAMSTALITTSYGTLTLGLLANSIGLISASVALMKALHAYAVKQ
jgi:hypothetical protein